MALETPRAKRRRRAPSEADFPSSPSRPALAVVPFENLSADPDQEYFVDGLTEDLITDLARLPSLLVIARTSCFSYKARPTKVQEIGRDLGVDYVLEGSVRRAGMRVRINVQLVDAASGHHIWADRFDRELGDVFALQDDVVRAVSASVDRTLDALASKGSAERPVPSVRPSAYDAYLRGRLAWNRRTAPDVRRAIELFEEAIRLDASSAQFHAALSQGLVLFDELSLGHPKENKSRALSAARRAVELDPTSAEAFTALGGSQVLAWDWAESRVSFDRAIALSPSAALPHHWRAHRDMAQGLVGEAVQGFERARQLDPLAAVTAVAAGFFGAFFAGEVSRARDLLDRAIELDASFVQARAFLALLLPFTGAAIEAETQATLAVEMEPESMLSRAALAFCLGRMGRTVEAERIVAAMEERALSDYVNPSLVALAHVGSARWDAALDWLERMVEVGAWTPFHLATAPMWDELRATARFREVAARMRVADRPVATWTPTISSSDRAFCREGEYWAVTYAEATCRVAHSRGMAYLAQLLAQPFRELAATFLESGHASVTGRPEDGIASDSNEDAGEMLDEQARHEYRTRIAELSTELEEAESCADTGRAELLRAQLEMLDQELRRAFGLGGRSRRAGSRAERARVNVTKAIRAAIARIRAVHPKLGDHLTRTVRTGMACAYHPDPSDRHDWRT